MPRMVGWEMCKRDRYKRRVNGKTNQTTENVMINLKHRQKKKKTQNGEKEGTERKLQSRNCEMKNRQKWITKRVERDRNKGHWMSLRHKQKIQMQKKIVKDENCLLYTSPSPRDQA
eukprot:TRINITY_DN25692_c0_g1_i1.p3 TRINITY_DN25692_c0_g1~~TRINITY_DN25692_c0_g1_i1.p3  ORF type:complete len:116 (+),score=18.26 TRINITY_DN25692_c0_g1_i1:1-348(+)